MSAICFPLPYSWTNFPYFISKEGKFGAVRKHDVHTGIDLYTRENAPVLAMQDGVVVAVEQFTGPPESPWWLPTKAILVEGESGVLVYGEVTPKVSVGDRVTCSQEIANVSPVLKPGEERKDIIGHSRFMLHLELYVPGTRKTVWWKLNEPQPEGLQDPMPLLVRAWNERSLRRYAAGQGH
jgi:murein DD-endopeptidase MepM/ murein hydrolase activator NlpD